jgi:signal transduction histidine kinase
MAYSGVRARTSRWPAAHPIGADALLAIGLALAAVLGDVYGHDHRSAAAPGWDVLLAAPIVLRRRAPATAAAALGAICLAQWLTDVLANGDLIVLVMLYSLGAWEKRRWLLAGSLLIAELGVVLAVTRWAPGPHQWLSGLMATGTVTAAVVIGLYVRTRRAYLASMIERAETAERDRDRQAQMAVAEERTRMAREMHDVIAHSLAVMITLNDAAAAVADPGTVRETVTQASDVGRQALREMQRMLGVLRNAGPAELVPQPGAAQLADLAALVRSAGLSVQLAVTGNPAELAPTTQLTIYRIVQESLTNVLKHGRDVTRVDVSVTCREGRVGLRIANDGHAGVPADPSPRGHGLAGIRERAALYDGQLRAGPTPGGGWEVHADLRLAETMKAT